MLNQYLKPGASRHEKLVTTDMYMRIYVRKVKMYT